MNAPIHKQMCGLVAAGLIAALLGTPSYAASARVRQIQAAPLGAAHEVHADSHEQRRLPEIATNVVTEGPSTLLVYPVAGAPGVTFTVPYFVDVDDSAGFRDFNCGELTFPGHSGHDPYIRSFREQAIGVPVFAVLDGTVVDLHDGEPDENTDNDSSKISNFIALRHANEQTTQYVHLRRGSVTHQLGQFVAAGTQIGLVGSSGASVAPHIHFELQYRRQPVEPMAGPCRPGRSFFADQPEATTRFGVLHTTLSKTNFANVRPAPFDDATPTGTFRRGVQTIYYKADVANVSSSTTYELYLQRPGSTQKVGRTTGALLTRSALRATVTWAIDVDLNVTGTWNIVLEVDGQTFRRPFTVVSTTSQIVNRPPNPISATIDPFRSGAVPVCRVSGDPLADPDYEVVAYRYVWQVNGTTVRDVRSAALTDALARNLVHGGQAVSCTVTASDAVSSAQPAVAHAEATSARRRAVRSR